LERYFEIKQGYLLAKYAKTQQFANRNGVFAKLFGHVIASKTGAGGSRV
jgi:lauroyl/myristoyl acyltransferase